MNLSSEGNPPDPVLEVIKYRVLGKPYSAWKAIIAEAAGDPDADFKEALFNSNNIRIDDPDADPLLYIIEDTNQHRILRERGVPNPTMLQLLLSTRIISLSEQDAIERMNAWLESQRIAPEAS